MKRLFCFEKLLLLIEQDEAERLAGQIFIHWIFQLLEK